MQMWHFGTQLSSHGDVELMVGLDDLRGLFQPQDFMILCPQNVPCSPKAPPDIVWEPQRAHIKQHHKYNLYYQNEKATTRYKSSGAQKEKKRLTVACVSIRGKHSLAKIQINLHYKIQVQSQTSEVWLKYFHPLASPAFSPLPKEPAQLWQFTLAEKWASIPQTAVMCVRLLI